VEVRLKPDTTVTSVELGPEPAVRVRADTKTADAQPVNEVRRASPPPTDLPQPPPSAPPVVVEAIEMNSIDIDEPEIDVLVLAPEIAIDDLAIAPLNDFSISQ
jgi:hypothetical protein